MTDVQYNKIINDLKSFSEFIVVDDEIVFFNMISNYYACVIRKRDYRKR